MTFQRWLKWTVLVLVGIALMGVSVYFKQQDVVESPAREPDWHAPCLGGLPQQSCAEYDTRWPA